MHLNRVSTFYKIPAVSDAIESILPENIYLLLHSLYTLTLESKICFLYVTLNVAYGSVVPKIFEESICANNRFYYQCCFTMKQCWFICLSAYVIEKGDITCTLIYLTKEC